MELTARDRRVHFPRRPLLMGILNINDDSFCGDGQLSCDWAIRRAGEMIAAGADIIDVGGESARTNRAPLPPEEELARIAPFIERFDESWRDATPRDEEQIFPPLLSLNTWRPEIAEPALALGGQILNDIGALPDDRNARACARHGAALVIMHSQGEPKVPHTHVAYADIMAEMDGFFREKISLARAAGLPESALIIDPGIDFAKQAPDNLRIYREAERLQAFRRPVLLPVSRKSVIGRVLGIKNPLDRDPATAAGIVAGMRRGAQIFRVHNVEMAWRAVATVYALARTA
jgi:dihydropteroate synthase